MPLPFLISSSDGNVAGGSYTRHGSPILSGIFVPSTSGAASQVDASIPGAMALVQHGTVVSTLGARVQVVSTLPAAVSRASYTYITQTTGAIATSSNAAGDAAPPYSGMGAALIWDAANKRLGVFSTVNNMWLFTNTGVTTSAGAGSFTSS